MPVIGKIYAKVIDPNIMEVLRGGGCKYHVNNRKSVSSY
jgi:hypothetical protein